MVDQQFANSILQGFEKLYTKYMADPDAAKQSTTSTLGIRTYQVTNEDMIKNALTGSEWAHQMVKGRWVESDKKEVKGEFSFPTPGDRLIQLKPFAYLNLEVNGRFFQLIIQHSHGDIFSIQPLYLNMCNNAVSYFVLADNSHKPFDAALIEALYAAL